MVEKIRGQKRALAIAIVIVVFLVGASVAIAKEVNKSIYHERQEMLSLVSSTAADLVDDNSVVTWKTQRVVQKIVVDAIASADTIEAGIDAANKLLDLQEGYYFLVDENGKYYASDGAFGKLTDFTYYENSTADSLEYLGTLPHMDESEVFLTYRVRLSEPVHVDTSAADTNIVFFAYAQTLTVLQDSLAEMFPGSINVFIYDSAGSMLYKEFGIKLLLEGYNIFPKVYACERTFGEDPDELVAALKNGEITVFAMRISGEDYFFCSAPLSTADWSLAFVVQADALVSSSGSAVSHIVIFIAAMAIVLIAAVIFALYLFMKRRIALERLEKSEQVAEAMQSASQAKTDFLSNMSHDIRTPINGIMGMTTIALGSLDDRDKVEDCLHKIDGSSHHLLSLVNDVLDMSRIERGKTEITCGPEDIRTIFDNCCSVIRGQLMGRDLAFVTKIEGEHMYVLADALHLRQVLINILGNAIKFTKDGGRIEFACYETECAENKVTYQFVVADNGIGMKDEFLEHIFEPFSQEEGRGRTAYQGTGLGMSITKQLVDLMGGSIEVKSAVGEGSTFTVTLTFDVNTNASVEEVSASCIAGTANIQGVRVLLVEDNELNSEIAVELLEDVGAHVDTAEDGCVALEKFAASEPGAYDAVLMDIMMPRMNGLEAARAIRALDRPDAANVPIIAMTANAFDDDVRATREAGMNAHLSKPIEISEVVDAIAYHCARRGN